MSEYIRKVKDGKVTIETPLFEDGDLLIVQIDKVPERRSLKALRYYFGAVVKAISEKTGHTKEEIHEYLKLELNPKEFSDLKTSEVRTIGGSTRQMTKEEFTKFVHAAEEIANWAGATVG